MTYRDEVLADNPVHYWRLEETSGSVVADEVGNLDGTVVGANLNVDGKVGSGAEFDGIDDHIDTHYLPEASNFTGGMTFEAWLYTRQLSGDHMFGSRSATNRRFFMGNANEVTLFGYGEDRNRSVGWPGANQWVHIVMTASGSGSGVTVRGYLDGDEVVTFTSESYNESFNTVYIGGTNGDDYWVDGFQDEVAIYHHVLSATRIKAHYDAAFVTADPANLQATVVGDTVALSWDASPSLT